MRRDRTAAVALHSAARCWWGYRNASKAAACMYSIMPARTSPSSSRTLGSDMLFRTLHSMPVYYFILSAGPAGVFQGYGRMRISSTLQQNDGRMTPPTAWHVLLFGYLLTHYVSKLCFSAPVNLATCIPDGQEVFWFSFCGGAVAWQPLHMQHIFLHISCQQHEPEHVCTCTAFESV
jgi:hypothetical protein